MRPLDGGRTLPACSLPHPCGRALKIFAQRKFIPKNLRIPGMMPEIARWKREPVRRRAAQPRRVGDPAQTKP